MGGRKNEVGGKNKCAANDLGLRISNVCFGKFQFDYKIYAIIFRQKEKEIEQGSMSAASFSFGTVRRACRIDVAMK